MVNNTQIELGTYVSQENLMSNQTQFTHAGHQSLASGSNEKQIVNYDNLKEHIKEAEKAKHVTNYIIDRI
jgi:hypothetical protein